MKNLSSYEQIDILKFVNFDQLFSVKQTNYYFNLLIEQNKWIFALKELQKISIFKVNESNVYFIDKSNVVKYHLIDEVLIKWQSAINKQIPLFLCEYDFEDSDYCPFYLKDLNKEVHLKLELPIFPKNIEEMQIIRFWLEQFFRSSFKYAIFANLLFNPEIIKLLFGNISLKFHATILLRISFYNSFYKNTFEFILNYLVGTKELRLDFENMDNIEEQNNFLFKLLLNSGIPCVSIDYVKDPSILYNLIINQIKMSADCSKIVPTILFRVKYKIYLKMEIKAHKMVDYGYGEVGLCEYKNYYNPKIKCLAHFYDYGPRDEINFKIEIKQIKRE